MSCQCTVSKKTAHVWLALALTQIHQFSYFCTWYQQTFKNWLQVYNFLNYTVPRFYLLYFAMKWNYDISDLKQRVNWVGKHSADYHRQGRWSMKSTTACMREGEGALFWTSAVNNRSFQSHPATKQALVRATHSLPKKTRCTLRV